MTGAKLPYEVLSSDCGDLLETFATFAEALGYLKGYRDGSDDDWHKCPPRIVNTDRHDGSEDGNYGGLAEDERAAIEEIG